MGTKLNVQNSEGYKNSHFTQNEVESQAKNKSYGSHSVKSFLYSNS